MAVRGGVYRDSPVSESYACGEEILADENWELPCSSQSLNIQSENIKQTASTTEIVSALICIRDELSALASSASGKGPDSFNLFDRNPDYKNDYGWRLALDLTENWTLRVFRIHNDSKEEQATNSIMHSMRGPEFVAAFGVSEERLRRILDAQREAVILPSASVAPTEPMDPREEEE
ncbi:hypothetical protein RND71_009835 [Anisodus tanguticus]|uniref:Uncharacterized protein n=1 Tax=Anisodus tanguticus TaxID=243964 RepID=A0AAE1VS75_9SOLA|nr:hypothetical protein RND71_009835 [Anisodus tanguticus]